LRSDLVAIVGAEAVDRTELEDLKRSIEQWCDHDRLIGCWLEPEPAARVKEEARVAVFTTAPPEREQDLRAALERQGLEVRVFSTSLARRSQLERDLERAVREDCDVYLTEIKAAAIEVVAAHAETAGAAVVFLRNKPVSLAGEPDLDAELLQLIDETVPAAPAR
jgi:cyclic 2,3-diphosphoglycerate synthetase